MNYRLIRHLFSLILLCTIGLWPHAPLSPLAAQAASNTTLYSMTWSMISTGSSEWVEDHDGYTTTVKTNYKTTIEANIVYYAYATGGIDTKKDQWWMKVSHSHTEHYTNVSDDGSVSESSWADTITDPERYYYTGFFPINAPGLPVAQSDGSFVITDPFKDGQHPRPQFTFQRTIVDAGSTQQSTEQSMLGCLRGVTDSWHSTSPGDLKGDGQLFTASKQIDKASQYYPAHIEWSIQIKNLSSGGGGIVSKVYIPLVVK